LTISWPGNYAGWILQSQTNTLQTGLGTNWVSIPTAINQILIKPAAGSAYYRLASP